MEEGRDNFLPRKVVRVCAAISSCPGFPHLLCAIAVILELEVAMVNINSPNIGKGIPKPQSDGRSILFYLQVLPDRPAKGKHYTPNISPRAGLSP